MAKSHMNCNIASLSAGGREGYRSSGEAAGGYIDASASSPGVGSR